MNVQELFKLGMKRDIPELLDFPNGPFNTIINVGCGNTHIEGTIGVDYPEWDADKDALPFSDDSIDGIHAYHFLEHCKEPVKILQEFQRVLKPGGVVNIVVPYYSSLLQAQDLDHKHSFTEETWKTLFNNQYYNKNKIEWKFHIGTNIIIGVVERNMCLMTQLIKE